MADSSEGDSPRWTEQDADEEVPPAKRRHSHRHSSAEKMEGRRSDPPFRHLAPYPTFSIFGPPQAPPTWHPYQFSYPPPPQWYPVYSDYNPERANPSGSYPRSGPSDAGPSRPPRAEPVEPANYGPIWPANYGPSRPANYGPSRPALYETSVSPVPSYENQSSHKGKQSDHSQCDRSVEGDNPG